MTKRQKGFCTGEDVFLYRTYHVELQIALTRNVQFSKRIGASRQTHYQVEKCDFQKDILEHCKKLMIPTVAGMELSFDKILVDGSFRQLFLDKFAFQQIFLNLLTNAVKYRNLDAPKEFQIVIKSHGSKIYEIPDEAHGCGENRGRQQKGFVFSVEDHGMGIEHDQKDHIFQLGYRIRGIEERDVRGLGMGLAIVDQILKDFYGNIWLSNFLKPTRFDIFLPEKLLSGEYTKANDWKIE